MTARLAVVVTPKASCNKVVGWQEDAAGVRELAVKVTAAPDKGKATKAVGKVLAAFFDVPKTSVLCVRGETSRHKMFELPLSQEELDSWVV